MRRVLDHNPLTGVTTYFDYDNLTDKSIITESQDVSDILDMNHAMQMDEDRSRRGIKLDQWHYARVPYTIITEMKTKHGVDFFDKNDQPKVYYLLNTEYKRFKSTHLKHEIKHARG